MAERAFVVGLSGVPGAGKTTLTQLLMQECKAASVVYYDQFQMLTRMMPEQIREWFARGGDPNEFSLSELIGELTRRTRIERSDRPRPLVLFETPFGRLHRASGAFIDFLVWIDTPLDLALSRAILAFLEAAQQDKAPNAAPDFVKWQIQYMLNYPIVRPLYLAQRKSISSAADLVLDGTLPVTGLATLVREALAGRGMVS